MNQTPHIAVIGLGYVGLPLAINLAHHFTVTGFDTNPDRIDALKKGKDLTGEVEGSQLKSSTLNLTAHPDYLEKAELYIITVPTPITASKQPDLKPLEQACRLIGRYLAKNNIVVLESTVYPGVTEDFCGALLEQVSGLKSGKHFFLGYSPERMNPGDKKHTVNRITKVVSGQTEEVARLLADLYGKINQDNIFIASNIKTAETAKVIENTQRDINIAFINEMTMIVQKLDLSIYDVLAAAKTKWNFVDFKPGLVGGHCIGVDPYYMAHCAKQLGHEPTAILAGRQINEGMSTFIAEKIIEQLPQKTDQKPLRILMLGLTFKENVPDLRNTKITDLIQTLQQAGFLVDPHDPMACAKEARLLYDLNLLANLDDLQPYDAVIGAVRHQAYLKFSLNTFERLLNKNGMIIDLKNMWPTLLKTHKTNLRYWSL